MKKVYLGVSISLLIAIFCNCSKLSNPLQKLEGKWTVSGDQGGGHSWFLEYTFTGGSYKMVGYPPISESGVIKLKEAHGDSLRVLFVVEKSDPTGYKNHEEWIFLANNTLTMNGNVFTKASNINNK